MANRTAISLVVLLSAMSWRTWRSRGGERIRGQLGFVLVGFDGGLSHFGAEIGAAASGFSDCEDELVGGMGFHDEAAGAGAEAFQDVLALGVHGEHDGAGSGRDAADFACGIDAVEQWHGEVEKCDVRM
jgi:hypothetical protein